MNMGLFNLGEKDEIIAELKSELQSGHIKYVNLEIRLKELEHEKNGLALQVELLKSKIEASEKELKGSRSQHHITKIQLDVAETQLRALERENHDLKNQLAMLSKPLKSNAGRKSNITPEVVEKVRQLHPDYSMADIAKELTDSFGRNFSKTTVKKIMDLHISRS